MYLTQKEGQCHYSCVKATMNNNIKDEWFCFKLPSRPTLSWMITKKMEYVVVVFCHLCDLWKHCTSYNWKAENSGIWPLVIPLTYMTNTYWLIMKHVILYLQTYWTINCVGISERLLESRHKFYHSAFVGNLYTLITFTSDKFTNIHPSTVEVIYRILYWKHVVVLIEICIPACTRQRFCYWMCYPGMFCMLFYSCKLNNSI